MQINYNASIIRKKLGADGNSPVDIFSLVENNEDFTLVFHPMSENISGLCIKDGKNNIIAINSELSLGRQRFTLAHELCHLFFHQNKKCYVCYASKTPSSLKEEAEANYFASYFLAPYSSLKEYIEKLKKEDGNKKITILDVIKMEQYFGLSRSAILYRLNYDGYITVKQRDELSEYATRKLAVKIGYDDNLYKPLNKERRCFTMGKYIRLVNELKERDLISESKYENLLSDAFREDLLGLDEEDEVIE